MTVSVGIRVSGLCLLFGFLSCCWRVGSRADIIGRYELGTGSQKISLEVKSNGTYEEVVTLGGAVADRRSGKWRWGPKFIDFDSLWIPKEFAPDYIRRADTAAAPGQPKYTEPGHWSLGAETHLGSVVLVIFPDAGVNFTMVRQTTN